MWRGASLLLSPFLRLQVKCFMGGSCKLMCPTMECTIHTETHDLCEETSCPVSPGDFVIFHTQVLPGFTPPGSYSLKMRIEDETNYQMTCIGFDFKIGFGSCLIIKCVYLVISSTISYVQNKVSSVVLYLAHMYLIGWVVVSRYLPRNFFISPVLCQKL